MLKLKLAVFGAICLSGISYAATPTPPSLKPPIVYESSVVSAKDSTIFNDALQASKAKKWSELRIQQQYASDNAVADFILWRLVSGAETLAGFDTLNTALERLDGWPNLRQIRINAEKAILVSALSTSERVLWFEARGGAISGEGKAAFAASLVKMGRRDEATKIIREAWRGSVFDRSTEKDILAGFSGSLSQNDHEARADFLLWGGRGYTCLLYTSPSPRDQRGSRMPSSA